MTNKCVVMARGAAPYVGVCGGEDDIVRIGPVVMKALPHASGAFGDVSLGMTKLMHLEIFVGAVSEGSFSSFPYG
jgi:hypothetical protein